MAGTQILAIANRKGGAGKTTTTLNLGAALAEAGQKVLLVDLDSTGNLTAHCGVELEDRDLTAYEVIAMDADAATAIHHIRGTRTDIAYDLIPADDAMQSLTLEGQLQTRLRTALRSLVNRYDYILRDTGPTIGVSTIQAITAADRVIIPAVPIYMSLTAIAAITDVMSDLMQINPKLKLEGVLLTQFDARKKLHQEIRQTLEEALPGHVFDVQTSLGVAVGESESYGLDLYEYIAQTPARKKTRAAEQYRQLAKQVLAYGTHK